MTQIRHHIVFRDTRLSKEAPVMIESFLPTGDEHGAMIERVGELKILAYRFPAEIWFHVFYGYHCNVNESFAITTASD
jgi:hypothetical protein